MGSKYQDNFFDASITIIRDMAADQFKTAKGDEIKGTSNGDLVKRFAEIGRVDRTGARSISVDKEYGFRPKMAGFVPDQVNYRLFKDSPGAENDDTSSQGFGDDPGESAGSVGVGIGGSSEEGGNGSGNHDWEVDYDKVGFELSLVSDLEGKAKSKPSWNPSHMNGENMSTLVISRRGKEDEDKGDDLPHRYFARVSDLFVPVATNKAQLTRVRFKGSGGAGDVPLGDDPGEEAGTVTVGAGGEGGTEKYGSTYFKKNREEESYEDGIWKAALNITPIENPGVSIEQKNEHNSGPGKEGWAAHDYVPGFPQVKSGGDDDADPPTNFPQGGWLYDAKQDTLAMWQDLIGIDAWKVEDCALPRYRNRFKQKVSIAYIRHDAHFMKVGDKESPPPKANGKRLSGRIYFTKDFQCPGAGVATPGGGQTANHTFDPFGTGAQTTSGGFTGDRGGVATGEPIETNLAEQEAGTAVCGEMIFDVKLADKDTNIKHESGEWRPMMMMAGGPGGDKYDYSYHSKPKKYSGSGTMGGGSPTPSGQTVADAGQGPSNPYAPVATASAGAMTTQSQMGSPPPESPGNSQNVNIFKNIQSPTILNPSAVFTTTKPKGYRTLKITTWIRASDVIPAGQSIEMNLIIGEYDRLDRGPQEFYRAAIVLTPELFPNDKRWRRVTLRWTRLDDSSVHPITVWVERRNDVSDVDVQVWILKHNIAFEP